MSATFDRELPPSQTAPPVAAEFDKTFPIGESGRFVLDNSRGRMSVRAWDRPEIQVHAVRKRGRSLEQYEATRIEWEHQGPTVVMRTVLDPSAQFEERGVLSGVAGDIVRAFGDLLRSTGKPAEVDYDVRVPGKCEVDVKGVSSTISLEGLTATASAHSVSGDITVENHRGDLRVQSVSGSLTGREVAGQIFAESVSGDVRLDGEVATLAAKTVSGGVEVTSRLAPQGRYEIRTVSGDATLRLPAQSAASIAVRGVSCDVDSELPCAVTRDSRWPGAREWHGTLNGGGTPIQYQTVSGSLRLRQSVQPTVATPVDIGPPAVIAGASVADQAPLNTDIPAEAAPSPAQVPLSLAEAPAADEDTDAMSVLQQLERGEINVDDALRQLDRLRGKSA